MTNDDAPNQTPSERIDSEDFGLTKTGLIWWLPESVPAILLIVIGAAALIWAALTKLF